MAVAYMEFDFVASGRRIKEERLSRGWKQSDLAAKSGVSDSHINGIERGNINLSVEYLVKIVNTFDMSVDKILYDELSSPEISCKMVDEIFKDCEPWEVKVLTECLISVRNSLKRHSLVPLADG